MRRPTPTRCSESAGSARCSDGHYPAHPREVENHEKTHRHTQRNVRNAWPYRGFEDTASPSVSGPLHSVSVCLWCGTRRLRLSLVRDTASPSVSGPGHGVSVCLWSGTRRLHLSLVRDTASPSVSGPGHGVSVCLWLRARPKAERVFAEYENFLELSDPTDRPTDRPTVTLFSVLYLLNQATD